MVLAACSTTMNMDYSGPVQAQALEGKVFALQTEPAQDAQFPPMPGCPFVANASCRHWVLQKTPTLLSYNQVLASALMKSGAKPTGDDAEADFIVRTTIAPAPGHAHIIDDQYLLAKSLTEGALTYERYIDQTIHAVFHVTVDSQGKTIARLDIPVQGHDQVEWGTFGNANDLDIACRKAYRGHLRKVVQQVLDTVLAHKAAI